MAPKISDHSYYNLIDHVRKISQQYLDIIYETNKIINSQLIQYNIFQVKKGK